MAGRFWTNDELTILKDNYANKPVQFVRELIPTRTTLAIKKKAFSLRLVRIKKVPWTDEEVTLLKHKCRAASSLKDLFPMRNYGSIAAKACSLGLHRNRHRSLVKLLPPLQLTNLERGYVAGIIDGEGCISLYFYSNPSPQPAIRISNTFLPMLERCQQILGLGEISPPRPTRGNRKPLYDYTILGVKGVEVVLRAVQPYLVAKKEQAELVLHYISRFRSGSFSLNEGKEIVSNMRCLNYRGTKEVLK